jgi:SAM-dependent methyltransferase
MARLHFLAHLATTGASHLHPLGRAGTSALLAALALVPGQRVLELGCGTGGTLLQLAASHAGAVHGLDLLPEMLGVAGLRLRVARQRAELCRASVTALPMAGASYDRVYCESVLGIQDEPGADALLVEVWRVLKPGGLFVANEAIWRPGTPARLAELINGLCLELFGVRQASQLPWDVGAWRARMAAAGFVVRSADPLEPRERTGATRAEARLRVLSGLVSALCKLGAYLRPAVLLRRAHYRRGLARVASYGRYIEPRLFVLHKPV